MFYWIVHENLREVKKKDIVTNEHPNTKSIFSLQPKCWIKIVQNR